MSRRDVLFVKRFDRRKAACGYECARMVSGLTLLRAHDTRRTPKTWSYVALVEELRRVSERPTKDAAELFRRMCFNALIPNTNDRRLGAWLDPPPRLRPDAVRAVNIERRDLDMVCADAGRYANAENLLRQHARFLLDREEAAAILSGIERCVAGKWYDVARTAGVSEQDCSRLSSAFAYPGFRYSLSGRPAQASERGRET